MLEKTVLYPIYPQTFRDSEGDGIGGLLLTAANVLGQLPVRRAEK